MRLFALFVIFVSLSFPVRAENKFLGLLELPPLCARPCPGSDRPLPLYEAPYQDNPSHEISRELYYDEKREIQDQLSPLWPQSEEFENGRHGAVIRETVSDIAYKILIGPYEYWVKAQDAGRFHPYPQILEGRLTYIDGWDSRLWPSPEEDWRLSAVPPAPQAPVRVLSFKKHSGKWWIRVEILEKSPCHAGNPVFAAKGWIPAHREDGSRTVWFEPDGC